MAASEFDHGMPLRLGLPLDPILQLYAGTLRRLPDVTWTGGNADTVAPANPARVCLFVADASGVGGFSLAPFPGPSPTVIAGGSAGPPTYIHCRDYPGMTQSAWVGSGQVGQTLAVWEYTLFGHWSA